MDMFIKKSKIACAFLVFGLVLQSETIFAMGSKTDTSIPTSSVSIEDVPTSNISLKDLAKIYWPDSNASSIQQDDACCFP